MLTPKIPFFFSKKNYMYKQLIKYPRLFVPNVKKNLVVRKVVITKKEIVQQNFFVLGFLGFDLLFDCALIGGLGYGLYKLRKNPELSKSMWELFKKSWWFSPRKDSKKISKDDFITKNMWESFKKPWGSFKKPWDKAVNNNDSKTVPNNVTSKTTPKFLKKSFAKQQKEVIEIKQDIIQRVTHSVKIKQAHRLEYRLRICVGQFMKNPTIKINDKTEYNTQALEDIRVAFRMLERHLLNLDIHVDTVAELLELDEDVDLNVTAYLNSTLAPLEVQFGVKFGDKISRWNPVLAVFSEVYEELEMYESLELPSYNINHFFFQYDPVTHDIAIPVQEKNPLIFAKITELLRISDTNQGTMLPITKSTHVHHNVFESFPNILPTIFIFSFLDVYNTNFSIIILNVIILCLLAVIIVFLTRRSRKNMKERHTSKKL